MCSLFWKDNLGLGRRCGTWQTCSITNTPQAALTLWGLTARSKHRLAQKIAVPLTISCRVSLAGSTRHIGLLFDAAVDHAYKPLIGRMKVGTV